MSVVKAMELEQRYKGCLEHKIFGTIPNEQDREICRTAAELCDYNPNEFYGALLHVLQRY